MESLKAYRNQELERKYKSVLYDLKKKVSAQLKLSRKEKEIAALAGINEQSILTSFQRVTREKRLYYKAVYVKNKLKSSIPETPSINKRNKKVNKISKTKRLCAKKEIKEKHVWEASKSWKCLSDEKRQTVAETHTNLRLSTATSVAKVLDDYPSDINAIFKRGASNNSEHTHPEMITRNFDESELNNSDNDMNGGTRESSDNELNNEDAETVILSGPNDNYCESNGGTRESSDNELNNEDAETVILSGPNDNYCESNGGTRESSDNELNNEDAETVILSGPNDNYCESIAHVDELDCSNAQHERTAADERPPNGQTDGSRSEERLHDIVPPTPPTIETAEELYDLIDLPDGKERIPWKNLTDAERRQFQSALRYLKREYIRQYRTFLHNLSSADLHAHMCQILLKDIV